MILGFIRFYRAEGTILKFTNCRFPNPITTPCFYGGDRLCPRVALGRVFGERREAAGAWLRRSVVALTGLDDLRVEQRRV